MRRKIVTTSHSDLFCCVCLVALSAGDMADLIGWWYGRSYWNFVSDSDTSKKKKKTKKKRKGTQGKEQRKVRKKKKGEDPQNRIWSLWTCDGCAKPKRKSHLISAGGGFGWDVTTGPVKFQKKKKKEFARYYRCSQIWPWRFFPFRIRSSSIKVCQEHSIDRSGGELIKQWHDW